MNPYTAFVLGWGCCTLFLTAIAICWPELLAPKVRSLKRQIRMQDRRIGCQRTRLRELEEIVAGDDVPRSFYRREYHKRLHASEPR